jgi:hypothetical protein
VGGADGAGNITVGSGRDWEFYVTLPVSEKEWQQTIVDAARTLGFLCYHTFDSRKSTPGYPDLTLLKHGRLIFVEVKTDKGVCSEAQQEWLTELSRTGLEVYVWRPSDWDAIQGILMTPPRHLRGIPPPIFSPSAGSGYAKSYLSPQPEPQSAPPSEAQTLTDEPQQTPGPGQS